MRSCVVALVLVLAACDADPSSRTRAVAEPTLLSTRDQVLALAPTDGDRVVVDTYFDLAAIPRPPLGEAAAREYLVGLAAATNARVGREVVRHQVDAIGNVLFTVEGSDGSTVPRVALQAHLDMVWAVANVAPGTDLAPYFANGVELELVDGWLQSVDRRTSIGADDGIGVALAARWFVEFEEPHPAMEILFTVSEEQGLVGARQLAMEITAPVLIGLDGFFADTFIYGCLGNQRAFAGADFPAAPVPAGSRRLTLAVSGLAGGHSGHDIGKPRLNAILTATRLAAEVAALDPAGGVRVLAAAGGGFGYVNVIPSSATVVLTVPDALVDEAATLAHDSFDAALAAATDEPAAAKLDITFGDVHAATVGLDAAGTSRFLGVLLAVPNGPLTFDPSSPNGINRSSNIGWLLLQPSGDGTTFSADTGFMARSYIPADLDAAVAAAFDVLRGWAAAPHEAALTPGLLTRPWFENVESPLYLVARALLPDFELSLTAGTNEMAVFSMRWPGVPMFAIGPEILDAHSAAERVELASVFRTNASLRALVAALSGP